MKHHFENHDLVTDQTSQLLDLTDEVRAAVGRAGVTNGMALAYSPHTTCAIVINEHETGFIDDFAELLSELAPAEDRYYRHDDLGIRTQGIEPDTAEFPNGHSHLRSGLLSSSSETVPVVNGSSCSDRGSESFLCELDRSRPRKVLIQVIGE